MSLEQGHPSPLWFQKQCHSIYRYLGAPRFKIGNSASLTDIMSWQLMHIHGGLIHMLYMHVCLFWSILQFSRCTANMPGYIQQQIGNGTRKVSVARVQTQHRPPRHSLLVALFWCTQHPGGRLPWCATAPSCFTSLTDTMDLPKSLILLVFCCNFNHPMH